MLVDRGKLMVHISTDALKHWHDSGERRACRPQLYSDTAIETALTIQQCLRLPLRATEGVVARLLVSLRSTCKAPDYSTLCLRSSSLPVQVRVRRLQKDEPLHLVVDASGVKVYGEGEWKVRRHGLSKYRTWKEVHLVLDQCGDIVAGAVTKVTFDGVVLPQLLDQVPEQVAIAEVIGDGAYDIRDCYDAIAKRCARPVIPPHRRARIIQHGNHHGPPHPRDEALRYIRRHGRRRWKIVSGYHRRSRVESAIARYKRAFGDHVAARTDANQRTQLLLRCKILNRFTAIGMPETYAAP